MLIPNVCAEYVRIEQGDTNYEIAHEWVEKHWSDRLKVAGGIRILEETCNRAFYDQQRGIFNMARLGQAIKQHRSPLDQLRLRHIETFGSAGHEITQMLWEAFFEALKPQKKPDSPYVATAKALHLLAPTFFVPFDSRIAKNYSCTGLSHKATSNSNIIWTSTTGEPGFEIRSSDLTIGRNAILFSTSYILVDGLT